MLYTTQYGERRIRVFNINIPVAKNLNGYFKGADVETLTAFILKKEASRVMVKGAKVTKENVINNLVNLLYVYRQKCAA